MALLLRPISSIPTLSVNFPRRLIHVCQVQQLYSSEALGVDIYINKRRALKERSTVISDMFKNKMNDFVNDPKSPIYTEDLMNMILSADLPDLDLVLKVIKKFNSQKEMRVDSFSFGPVVMRFYHFIDAPNEALQCFEDPANEGFFDEIVSIQILLDLLFRHAMYNEMFKVFDKVQERQINLARYKKCVVLIMAACYKQNTPESLQYASNLYSEMSKSGAVMLMRICTLFADLALQQNAPQIAIEAISGHKQSYVTIRNIKAMALAKLGKFDETISVLRSVINDDQPERSPGQKHTFFKETISFISEAIKASDNKDVKLEFSYVEKALRDRSLIDNKNLSDMLLSEIPSYDYTRWNTRTFGGPHQVRKMPFKHAPRY